MSSFKKRENEVVKDDVVFDPWFDDDDDDEDDDDNTIATAGIEMVEAEPEMSKSKDDLMSLTIPLLKDKLREAGKTVSGNKANLVERLLSP